MATPVISARKLMRIFTLGDTRVVALDNVSLDVMPGECVAVIRKHPHVYADLSALHYRPFQLYHSLMLVQEYGVWDKVLFGTDYPFTTVTASIDGLRKLNAMLDGTALPRLDAAKIEAMIHRDSLPLLGLA